jgi:hypothetical protein
MVQKSGQSNGRSDEMDAENVHSDNIRGRMLDTQYNLDIDILALIDGRECTSLMVEGLPGPIFLVPVDYGEGSILGGSLGLSNPLLVKRW